MKEEIQKKIQILRQVGIEKILSDPDTRGLFHEVATKVFGENCLNCDGKIREKFVLLLTKTDFMESKYKLKKDTLISMNSPDWKEDISNSNLTNEKAEMLLNMSLSYIKLFEEAPELEKLKKAHEEGARSLSEVGKVKVVLTFSEELIALKGIGKSTAKKLIEKYPTKDLLIDALSNDDDFSFLGRFEDAAKDGLKAL